MKRKTKLFSVHIKFRKGYFFFIIMIIMVTVGKKKIMQLDLSVKSLRAINYYELRSVFINVRTLYDN